MSVFLCLCVFLIAIKLHNTTVSFTQCKASFNKRTMSVFLCCWRKWIKMVNEFPWLILSLAILQGSREKLDKVMNQLFTSYINISEVSHFFALSLLSLSSLSQIHFIIGQKSTGCWPLEIPWMFLGCYGFQNICNSIC